MPANGEVDQGRGDVDRVDPLVGHRADVAGADVVDDPELGLPGAGRHELAGPGDLAAGAGRRRRRADAAANRAMPPSTSRPRASASCSGLAEKARPTVQR